MLCPVIEHAMLPFGFQAAQNNSASPSSSVWQFECSNGVIPCSITEQRTPSFVLTVMKIPCMNSLIRFSKK